MTHIHKNQKGALDTLLIPLILVVLLLIGAGAFGAWAFSSRQDYKNNTDQKIASAVTVAEKKTTETDTAQAAEAAKQPLKPYNGPEAFGSVVIKYPKTWSAYVDESGGNVAIDGYFQPDFVPSIDSPTAAFALRLQVIQQTYDQALLQFSSLAKQGKVTVTPFTAAKVPSVVGVRIDGQIFPSKKGSMILLPLRDKTFKLWTESDSFTPDFNANILPNFSFSP